MDYSQLSDLEITQRVSNAIPGRFIFYPDCVWDSEWEKTFDPCNKAADAWPIITENKISIYAMSEADARGKWGAEAFYPNEAYHFNDNPLRASMIVFLMMQDTTHA
ncbi:TPA: phage protein NinX family protein [Enterobacter hormaechei]